MSSGTSAGDHTGHDSQTDEHLAVCQFCGGFIDEPGKRCAALDNGRCEP